MQAILGGQGITWEVPFLTEDGVQLEAVSVEYRIINQADVEILAKTALTPFVAGSPFASIAVPALLNTVTNATAGRELRLIELFVTTADGITKLQYSYIIEAGELLSIGLNSFQGYASALMTGYELPSVDSWSLASKINRVNALIAAWRNVCKLNLLNATGIAEITAVDYALLPIDMRNALSRAQVLEADFLLGGDEVGDIRRSGIMSATVGESSQFFRSGKPIEGHVCKRAARELSKYIIPSSVVIGRA